MMGVETNLIGVLSSYFSYIEEKWVDLHIKIEWKIYDILSNECVYMYTILISVAKDNKENLQCAVFYFVVNKMAVL